jgi:two-component system, OmpR family, response regulator CpxR
MYLDSSDQEPMHMETILIIDDDVGLCTMLRDYFALHNVKLAMRHHGFAGLDTACREKYDMVLLDVMLPGMDGFEVLRHLRPVSDVGIVLLSSRGEANDRIVGLDNGADDYLNKPFNPRELLARMRAVYRRLTFNAARVAPHRTINEISISGFVINASTRSVGYRAHSLELTENEFSLLEALLQYAGVVLSREHLFARVFNRGFNPVDRSLDMLVSRLRRKLTIADNPGAAIKTIRSSGYLFALGD